VTAIEMCVEFQKGGKVEIIVKNEKKDFDISFEIKGKNVTYVSSRNTLDLNHTAASSIFTSKFDPPYCCHFSVRLRRHVLVSEKQKFH